MHKTMASKCPTSCWAENLFDIIHTSLRASALQHISRKSLGQKHLWMHAVLSGLPHWAEVYEKWAESNSVVILFLPPRGGWGSQCLLCGLASHTQTHNEDKEMPWTVGVSSGQTSSLSCVLTIHGTHSWLRFIFRVLTWHGWNTLLQLGNTVRILFKPILGQTHD